VSAPTGGPAYAESWWPAVALTGPDRVGVAWPACWAACAGWTSSTRVDLLWAESKDDGATWFAPQVLASASTTSARRVNSYPSIVWFSNTRAVSWVGEIPNSTSYRVHLRTASGAP
jgi:hypothetical protein